MPKLFPCLSNKLEEVTISIGSQDDSSHGLQFLRGRSPAQSIDRSLKVAFLVFNVCIELHNFARFDKIVDPYKTITMSTGYQRIFVPEFREHYFALLLDSGLQPQLLLQLHFFDYSD